MFRINATTTDEQIHAASKETLIRAVYTGRYAVLIQDRLRSMKKTEAIAEAIQYRDSLKAK